MREARPRRHGRLRRNRLVAALPPSPSLHLLAPSQREGGDSGERDIESVCVSYRERVGERERGREGGRERRREGGREGQRERERERERWWAEVGKSER